MHAFLEKKGVKNGEMTREHYVEFFNEQQAARSGETPPPAPGSTPGAAAPAESDAELENRAREEFKRYDRNNDGALSPDEMPETLYRERERWDTNKNGTIEFSEYKEYFKVHGSRRGPGGPGRDGTAVPIVEGEKPPVEEEKRPVVYHAGNLPKELPPWFEQYDTDKDAQVGLYEWKAAGRPVSEFLAMDQNGDGFLTVEEVLRYQKAQAKANGTGGGRALAANLTSTGDGQGTEGGAPGFGGRGMRGMGPGGPGGMRGMGPGGPGGSNGGPGNGGWQRNRGPGGPGGGTDQGGGMGRGNRGPGGPPGAGGSGDGSDRGRGPRGNRGGSGN
jgi:Ca2+-binding EF-hand superfamily protein